MMLGAGMGATGDQILATTGSVAGSTAALLWPVIFGAAAGPVGLAVGAAITGVTTVLSVLGVGKGCGQSCIATSANADEIERAMQANLAAFQAGQIDRNQALANNAQLWAALQQACGSIGGDAGRNCIADRQAGACKWRDAADQCWNWDIGYRQPILAGASTIDEYGVAAGVSGMSPWGWLLLLGAGLAIAEAA